MSLRCTMCGELKMHTKVYCLECYNEICGKYADLRAKLAEVEKERDEARDVIQAAIMVEKLWLPMGDVAERHKDETAALWQLRLYGDEDLHEDSTEQGEG